MHLGQVVRPQRFDVLLECAQTLRIFLDEVGAHRATRQRLQTERARSGVEVEHPRVGQVALQDTHPRLAHAVEGRANVRAGGRADSSSAPAAGDYSHSDLAESNVGNARLEIALAAIVVALETERDVYLGAGLKLRGALGQSPADRIQRASARVEDELESVLSHRARRPGDDDVPRQQDGRRIANAERLEVSEQRFDAPIEAIDVDLQIDADLRNQIGWSENGFGNVVEAGRE